MHDSDAIVYLPTFVLSSFRIATNYLTSMRQSLSYFPNLVHMVVHSTWRTRQETSATQNHHRQCDH